MNATQWRPPSTWLRLRVQLVGCLVVAGLIPYLARLAFAVTALDVQILHIALAGNAAAIVIAVWLIRNVSTYPGAEANASILTSFLAAYGLTLAVFVFGRFQYSRLTLAAGFAISVLWLHFTIVMAQRSRRLRVGVLPLGDVGRLDRLPTVDWVDIQSIDQDVEGLDLLAADLRVDLPSLWDRRLADYALMGVPVFHGKHLAESLTGRVELEHMSENSFGSLMPRAAYMTVKHALDWLAAVFVGVAGLPILLAIALGIKLTSPGPALFVQERIGYRGVPFSVYKFRTMTAPPPEPFDERDRAITKADDVRVTRFGRFLRSSRLDELPQLLNVLKGEMSWIGPRPEAAVLSRWYEAEIPFYRYRHIVRPGIAGWAQVCQGHVAAVEDVRDKLHYDFYYIKHYSPWIDLLIVTRTIKTMITGFGSR